MVVLQHTRGIVMLDYAPGQGPVARVVYLISGFGNEAVIVFFVLSGFLVGSGALDLAAGSSASQRDRFARARFARIFGVLWPALALSLIVAGLIADGPIAGAWSPYMPNMRGTDSPARWAATALMLNEIWPRFLTPFNPPLWSLACEWTYYSCAICGVYIATRDRRPAAIAFCLYAAALVVATAIGNPGALWLGSFWLLGLLAARLPPYRRPLLSGAAFAAALLISRFHVLGQMQGYALIAVATMALIGDKAWQSVTIAPRLGAMLAGFSFSLYAIHWPVVTGAAALANAWGHLPTRQPPGAVAYLLTAALVALAYAASWGFSRATERGGGWLSRAIESLASNRPSAAHTNRASSYPPPIP